MLTGLAPTLGVVYVLRFLAALGVGAEYAIINAAIAEFMPARVRGRANAIVMNLWPVGAILAALLAYLLLDTLALDAGHLVALHVRPRWAAGADRAGLPPAHHRIATLARRDVTAA